ncbi:MAG: redoxin domain-containing protein [Bacteroidales bacterium]|nr:redoxin domain-containing protein [Bacteroidales bacterium]
MSRPRLFLLFSTLLTSVFASCQRYEDLSADAFLERLGLESDTQLVDVRTPEEYAAGHLPGAANIDWLADGFIDQAKTLLDSARPVMLYCRTGKRSAAAAAKLSAAGFRVGNLLGGYQGWTEGGRPVLKSEDDALEAEYSTELLVPGSPAPDFSLKDLEGNPVNISDFRGRSVVLVFWASWCPDCRAEVPDLKKMAADADPAAVQFVSVSFDRSFETLCDFVAEQELPGVQLFDPAGKADSAVAAAYGVRWIPSLYLIGPDGSVVLSTILASKIAAALAGYPPRLLALTAAVAPAPSGSPAAGSDTSTPATHTTSSASHAPCADDSCEL